MDNFQSYKQACTKSEVRLTVLLWNICTLIKAKILFKGHKYKDFYQQSILKVHLLIIQNDGLANYWFIKVYIEFYDLIDCWVALSIIMLYIVHCINNLSNSVSQLSYSKK